MVDKLDSLSRIADRMIDKLGKRTSTAKSTKSSQQRNSSTAEQATLRVQLTERLRPLLRDGKLTFAEKRKAFIREILLWRFGNAVLEHPGFKTMLDELDSAIGHSVSAQEKLSAIITEFSDD